MTALRNVARSCEKEWRHYFGSPIAWVVLVRLDAALRQLLLRRASPSSCSRSMAGAQQMEMGGAPKMSLNEWVISPVLQNMAVVALFVAPMLTMRLFAEEKRQGTMELLATAPLTDLQIVLGKFLAAAGLYALMILAGLLNVVLIWYYATVKPEWKPVVTGALALLLFGCCFIALGLFISTLTRNQIVAGILSLLPVRSACGRWAGPTTRSGGPVSKVVAYLGVTTHLDDLMKGVLALKDIVFYLSFIAFGLFLAHQSVESQRWRA